MAITYGDYVPSRIPNATMQEVLKDGELYNYSIEAADGYVLHDSRADVYTRDEETGEEVFSYEMFREGSAVVTKNYNFDNVISGTYTYTDENGMEVIVPVEKIGMYEFYTLPENIVSTNQIFGGGNNNEPEVM